MSLGSTSTATAATSPTSRPGALSPALMDTTKAANAQRVPPQPVQPFMAGHVVNVHGTQAPHLMCWQVLLYVHGQLTQLESASCMNRIDLAV